MYKVRGGVKSDFKQDMDTEMSGEGLDASDTPQPEETVMEKEVVTKLETSEESTEPEKPPAADEETEQAAVNGHDTDVVNLKETVEFIVTETVTVSEEKTEMEFEESLPTEKSDTESVPNVPPPEPDESSEKISDPVAALDTEPENIQPEQQPVPENNPEPLPVQTPLTESAPEPEPEKLAESVPVAEIQEQTLPEPVTLQQPVGAPPPPPSKGEGDAEQVETETKLQTTMNTGAEVVAKEEVAENEVPAKPSKDEEEEKPAETVVVTEVSPEKPTEASALKAEASAEIENVKPTEEKKEAEAEKSESDTLKGAEAAPESEGAASEKKDAEIQKEEDAVPASGSLSFAFLEREQTKDTLQTSRILFVLRGLPGSGKSFLARAIADAYKDHCSVVSADDHGVKPENPESSAEGYKALDEAVVARCGAGTSVSVLIVVDDTNHTQDRLARLGEIAEQQHLVAIFLEPRTEWSRDVALLITKTKRGLEATQLEAMRAPLEEMSLPLFFGWFLLHSVQEKVRCTSMDFLKTLDTLEAFKKHMIDCECI